MTTYWKPSIGSTVRAKLPNNSKRKHRAIIADSENDRFLLLWEEIHCQQTSYSLNLPDYWCSYQDIEPLLAFEEPTRPIEGDFAQHKTYGDQLLTLGDAASAIRHYESALQSVRLEIGCSILLEEVGKKKSSSVFRRAEVDCIEDDGSLDVTILPCGSEKTVNVSQIALIILESDPEALQVRSLLNCARCCLQIAEVSSEIKSKFTQRALHFCSLCIMLLLDDNDAKGIADSTYLQTAFLLRSQAFADKHQYDAALSDISALLQLDPDNEVGRRRVNLYKRKKEELKTNEKRLVKAMCGYIQQATNGVSALEDQVASEKLRQDGTDNKVEHALQGSFWIVCLIIAIFAWIIQKSI
jgi:tetratricopeptide (TPR) repeat protein